MSLPKDIKRAVREDVRRAIDRPVSVSGVEVEAGRVRAVRFKDQLPTDTLMLADNHHMLHGRTTYTDERRHLIRIRISDVPNAERIGPSGVVRD